MDRLKRSDSGFTLLELLIAAVLFTVVILAGSSLLINFGKFSSNVVKSEASLMGTALGAFEQIVGKIEVSERVTIPATTVTPVPATSTDNSIEIKVHPPGTPYDPLHTNDTVYTFWKDGAQLKCKSKVGSAAVSADSVIAKDITSLIFVAIGSNQVRVTLDVQTADNMGREHLDTIAVARSSRA